MSFWTEGLDLTGVRKQHQEEIVAPAAAEAERIRRGGKHGTHTVGAKPENVTENAQEIKDLRIKYTQCALSSLLSSNLFGSLVANPKTAGGTNGYKKFMLLDDDNPGEMISVINRVSEAYEFFGIDSRLASSLVPYIRLFIVDKDDISHEFTFDMVDTLAKNPEFSKSSFLAGKDARGSDAGILEFTVEDKTTQPAEEGNTLVANLQIFFRTMGDFLTGGSTRNPKSKSSKTYNYSNLVKRENINDPEFNPLDNRIRVIYGWQDPDPKTLSELNVTSGKAKRLKAAIKKSRRVLNLTLREHTFEINENGSVLLDITYNAAIDGVMRDPATNLLATSVKRREELAATKKKAEKTSNAIDELSEIKGDNIDEDTKDEIAETVADLSDEQGALQENMMLQKQRNRKDTMMAIVTKLLGSRKGGGYLKRLYIPQELVGALGKEDKNLNAASMKDNNRCGHIQRLLQVTRHFNQKATNYKGGSTGKKTKEDVVGGRITGGGMDTLTNFWSGDTTAADREETRTADRARGGPTRRNQIIAAASRGAPTLQQSTFSQANAEQIKRVAQNKYGAKIDGILRELIFFHYGDLVEVALEVLEDSPEFKKRYQKHAKLAFPNVVLGPVMIDKNKCGEATGRKAGMNLADVPIALDTFTNWFVNSVVKKDVTSLLFRDFMNALNKEILPSAMGLGCMHTEDAPPIVYSTVQQISVKIANANDVGLGRPGDPPIGVDTVRDRVGEAPRVDGAATSATTKDYMLVFVPTIQALDLKADRLKDQSKGIYHLYAGRSDGTILNMGFSRNNMPSLPEAKTGGSALATDIAGGNRYDLNLELVGNTFFRIGHYLYLNVLSLGFGSVTNSKSLSNQLGVGGYYQVDSINYILTPAGFRTELSAIFQFSTGAKKQPKPGTVSPSDRADGFDPSSNPEDRDRAMADAKKLLATKPTGKARAKSAKTYAQIEAERDAAYARATAAGAVVTEGEEAPTAPTPAPTSRPSYTAGEAKGLM